MKTRSIAKNTVIIVTVIVVILTSLFCVSGVPDETSETKSPTKVTVTVAETEKTTVITQTETYTLPSASVAPAPTAITVKSEDSKKTDLAYGIVSWVCVALGVLIVTLVLINNKTQYHRGNGKHRYEEGNKITDQKRLLNDDYYNHRKTESYFNKDTRK